MKWDASLRRRPRWRRTELRAELLAWAVVLAAVAASWAAHGWL